MSAPASLGWQLQARLVLLCWLGVRASRPPFLPQAEASRILPAWIETSGTRARETPALPRKDYQHASLTSLRPNLTALFHGQRSGFLGFGEKRWAKAWRPRRSPDLDHEIFDRSWHFLEPVRHTFGDDDHVAFGKMARLAARQRSAANLIRRGVLTAC